MQLGRLRNAGYGDGVIWSACRKLLNLVKKDSSAACDVVKKKEKEIVAIPYLKNVSHRLKKVWSRYNVNVVFSAKNKLNRLCSTIEESISKKGQACSGGVKHEKQFVLCKSSVAYCVPLNCCHFCVGQTGRYLNVPL